MDIDLEHKKPPYFSSIELKNFRGFKRSEKIPLAPLTFLVGANSSGKSTLFDALLLISQSQLASLRRNYDLPKWGGTLVDLGSYNDAVYRHNPRYNIEINIGFCGSEKPSSGISTKEMVIGFQLTTVKKDRVGRLATVIISDTKSKEKIYLKYSARKIVLHFLNYKYTIPIKAIRRSYVNDRLTFWASNQIDIILRQHKFIIRGQKAALRRMQLFLSNTVVGDFLEEMQRVSSGRAAPRRWYSGTDLNIRRIDVFDAVDPAMVQDPHEYIRYSQFRGKENRPVQNLSGLLDKLDIASKINDTRLSPYHVGIILKDNITKVTSHLIDVGYGASQVIPVLRAIISPSWGPLLVEQPEIHLHPKAQGNLAELLCNSSIYRQTIIETHSEHMINRARILIAEGKLSCDDVIVLFVYRDRFGSHVKPITIGRDGNFKEDWPGGFFDERYQDTMSLLKIQAEGNK